MLFTDTTQPSHQMENGIQIKDYIGFKVSSNETNVTTTWSPVSYTPISRNVLATNNKEPHLKDTSGYLKLLSSCSYAKSQISTERFF
jgi:hypothetical protein